MCRFAIEDCYQILKMKKTLFLLLSCVSLSAIAQIPGDIDSSFGTNGYAIHFASANPENVNANIRKGLNDVLLMVGSRESTDFNPYIIKAGKHGKTDNVFGQNGVVSYDPLLGADDYGFDIAQLPDGKFLLAGIIKQPGQDILLMRINPDGSLDNTFGNNGYNTYNISGADICVKMIVGNNSIYLGTYSKVGADLTDAYIMKLNMDGTVDANFGNGGLFIIDPNNGDEESLKDFEVLTDGSVIAIGTTTSANSMKEYIARGTSTGNIDNSFDNDGYVLYTEPGKTYFSRIKQHNGNFYISGHNNVNGFSAGAIYCFDVTGSLNSSFASGKGRAIFNIGSQIDHSLYDFEILNDGSIFAAGATKDNGGLFTGTAVMFTPDGSLDTRYNNAGYKVFDYSPSVGFSLFHNIIKQENGQLVLGGRFVDSSQSGVHMVRLKLQTTSIDDNNFFQNDIQVYPNPSSGTFNLGLQGGITRIEMFNATGTKIVSPERISNNTYRVQANVPAGIYYIRVSTDAGIVSERLMLNR